MWSEPSSCLSSTENVLFLTWRDMHESQQKCSPRDRERSWSLKSPLWVLNALLRPGPQFASPSPTLNSQVPFEKASTSKGKGWPDRGPKLVHSSMAFWNLYPLLQCFWFLPVYRCRYAFVCIFIHTYIHICTVYICTHMLMYLYTIPYIIYFYTCRFLLTEFIHLQVKTILKQGAKGHFIG